MVSIEIKRKICRLFFCEKKSQRAIAIELGVHRNTVRKCIEEMRRALTSHAIVEEEVTNWHDLILKLVQPSVYPVANRKKQKVTDEIIQLIMDRWRKSGEKNRMRVFWELKRELGSSIDANGMYLPSKFRIGYSTFCEIIQKYSSNQ